MGNVTTNKEAVRAINMANSTELFLATIHSGGDFASGDTGLLVASSTDGIHFRNITGHTDSLYWAAGGVRDPSILYWRDQWYVVYSYGANVAPLVLIIRSADLLNWSPVGELRFGPDSPNNLIDVPQWIVDPAGGVHLIGCRDSDHDWVERRALSPDPETWGNPANWSEPATIVDANNQPLIEGNAFVALHEDVYYRASNPCPYAEPVNHFLRTSPDLVSGWSDPRPMKIAEIDWQTDSLNLVVLADGTFRFYISNGNSRNHKLWYTDSADLGATWTPGRLVQFDGFAPPGVNWAHFHRITNAEAIAGIDNRDDQ